MLPSVNDLRAQWARFYISSLLTTIIQAAIRHKIPVAWLVALASRETNLYNLIGDDGHGVGILQADIQHPIALYARDSGEWASNPAPLVDFCAALAAGMLAQARAAYPEFTDTQHLKIAASSYNCGFGNAQAGVADGNSDERTTGGNYGEDVMFRYSVFGPLVDAHLINHPGVNVMTPAPAPYNM